MTSTPTAPGHPAPQPPDGPYITVAELAAAIRVSRNTIYRLIEADQIPGTIRVSTRTLRIPASAASQLLAARTTAPPCPAPLTRAKLSQWSAGTVIRQIAADLAAKISDGTYHRRRPIPANATLAARWRTSPQTVETAKRLLAAHGILTFAGGRYRIP
jgi:excisionase family DNA binding protein